MADLPKGRITGRFMHITADSEDGDANPDFTPAAGSVIIAPMVPVMRFPGQTPPLVGLMEPIICPVIGGLMYRPGTDATDVGDPLALGVTVPASDQPDGNPKVMLYEATFMFENRDVQPAPVAFMVPTDGVVDLSVPIPALPEQPAIVAVSYVDASQAIAANAAAQGWATSASRKADNAAASATAAAGSATAAAGSATAAAGSATAAAGSAESINWNGLSGKPPVIAAGATAAAARTAIDAAEVFTPSAWVSMTLAGLDRFEGTARVRRLTPYLCEIRVEGIAKVPSTGNMLTFPVGYRPPIFTAFACAGAGATSGIAQTTTTTLRGPSFGMNQEIYLAAVYPSEAS